MCRGWPLTAHTSASETPVLPPVYSTTAPPGRQPPVGFGGVNHRQRHPVLHAAGGVLRLELHENPRAAGRCDAAKRQHRRVANSSRGCPGGNRACASSWVDGLADPGPAAGLSALRHRAISGTSSRYRTRCQKRRAGRQPLRESRGGNESGARRCAREDALVAGHPEGHRHRLVGRHQFSPVVTSGLPQRDDEARAKTLSMR